MLPEGGRRRRRGGPGPHVCGVRPRLPASASVGSSARCKRPTRTVCLQERIQLYQRKVQKLESEKWLQENSAQTQVNVAAANRFISAAIPDLTPAQRGVLKAVRPSRSSICPASAVLAHLPLQATLCGRREPQGAQPVTSLPSTLLHTPQELL